MPLAPSRCAASGRRARAIRTCVTLECGHIARGMVAPARIGDDGSASRLTGAVRYRAIEGLRRRTGLRQSAGICRTASTSTIRMRTNYSTSTEMATP